MVCSVGGGGGKERVLEAGEAAGVRVRLGSYNGIIKVSSILFLRSDVSAAGA